MGCYFSNLVWKFPHNPTTLTKNQCHIFQHFHGSTLFLGISFCISHLFLHWRYHNNLVAFSNVSFSWPCVYWWLGISASRSRPTGWLEWLCPTGLILEARMRRQWVFRECYSMAVQEEQERKPKCKSKVQAFHIVSLTCQWPRQVTWQSLNSRNEELYCSHQ